MRIPRYVPLVFALAVACGAAEPSASDRASRVGAAESRASPVPGAGLVGTPSPAAAGSGGAATPGTAAPRSGATPAADDRPEAPDFELATLDGGTFRLSDYRGKLPVVLNFWAPW